MAAVAAAEPSPDDDEVEKDQEEEEADAGASSTGGQEMTGENVDTSTGAEKSAESSSDREESDRDQGSGEESEGGSSNRKEKSSGSDDDDESGKDVETGASNVEDAAKEDEKAMSSGSDAKEKEETASTEADQGPNSVEESSASEKIPEEDEMPPPSHAEANKLPDSRKRKVRPSAVASAGMLKAAVLGAIADAQHVRDRERHRSRHKPLVSRSGKDKRGSEPSLRSVVVVETGDQETESKQKRVPIKRKIPDPGKKD